ncbi:Sjogren's syndrome/scleroderma autoantigen 1 family protein [Halococcus agarilyticus]|uniref:Sjogren's syndrome/scleroderma autoantigen 1 family protein n=1 Tax=Halococcus agarilyticus TaxID=1232219 RepID=UPI0006782476|nr:Sjogren's syndrome/scleroderma autoantigen 1 family protein [Halococcus agarilyticus]
MSDFDKEAEREKLRERFAEDDEKRETTEQMSELLLQGATMTNSHCDTCGNPLFRYDGQTFCSTCQRAENGETATDAPATADDAPAAGEATGTENETAAGSQQISVDDPRDEAAAEPDRAAEPEPRETTATERPEPTPTDDRRAPSSGTRGDATNARTDQHSTESADDLAATEASLSRTLHRLASAAENIDDLGRAREHLAATHEAAEALDAVRNARR